MSVWNNSGSRPQWNGSGINNVKAKNLTVSTLTADQVNANYVSTNYVQARSLSTLNAEIGFLSNLVINTGVIGLGIGPTFLTANDGILYVNGDAVAFPSSLSTIADWSFFTAVSDVNLGRSSIYNVQSISTNLISTGTLLTRSISTANLAVNIGVFNNISSGNILYDTLNGRAGTVGTLSGSNLVYTNGVISNLTSVTANTNSFIANNIVASNLLRVPSISTIIVSSFLVEANTLYGQSTATGYLAANEISTGTLKAKNIYNVQQMLLENTGEIRGNQSTLVQVGNLSSMTLNTSSFNTNIITVNNLNVNTINSSNIVNSNNFSNTGNFSNAGNTQLNTLTTSGQVYTQDILNVQGLMSLQSDVYGSTENITIPIAPFVVPEYQRSINDIKNVNCEAINVIGGATGNNFFPPYRNNSIVNIGETELTPGILNIYGVNAELTTALSVYGLASITGDTTINGLTTVNGITDLNGDLTVIGLTSITGDTDIIGLTSITGNTDINGACEITGETNILGALTAEAGIVAVGALGFTGGDITIGGEPATSPANNFNFYNYYRNTNVEALTVNKNGDFRQDVGVAGNLNVGGIIFGTVVSGSESISTLNVSTLRAYNISSITNTTEEFFVSSIAGYSNRTIQFRNNINVNSNIVASNNITALGGINTVNTVTLGLRTSSITSYYPNTDLPFINGIVVPSISTNNISTGGITIGDIFTNNISTNTLNMITGTGNQLLLQSYEGQAPTLSFSRTIDGVDFVDGVMGTSDETGLILAGLSTFTVSVLNDITIGSAENVFIKSENAINVSTNAFVVVNAAAISSIYTNYIQSGLIDIYSQDIENSATVTFYRDIDGEKVPDGLIGSDTQNGFSIVTPSTMRVIAGDDMLIQSFNGRVGIISENSNIILSAPETLIYYSLNVSTISTGNIYSDNLFANNGIGTANVYTSNLFSDYTSTGSIYADRATIVNDLSANNLFTTNLLTYYIGNPLPFQSPIGFNDNLNIAGNDIYNTATLSASNISTNFISTGSLFVNNSVENSISSLRISSGSLFSGVISSIQFNASSINANRAFINNLTGSGSATNTTNLYPQSAGAQIGFFGSGGTNSGGFYNNINIRSTITQVIVPDIVGAFSNNIRVQGNLSTQNVFVSSINNKLYPYTSTLNIPFSSFSITGNQAGTPILLYSNVDFRTQGFHRISQKAILSKDSGGTSADIHGNIFYSLGSFPSTPTITDGYSALPFVNQDNASTFTTLMTEFYVSTPTTRNILYYDATANNYGARLYMGSLFDSVTPDFGLSATRIPNIQ